MSDPNIKQLTVTGNAAESFLNKGSRKRRRSSANKTQKNEPPVVGKQDQHGGTSPGTLVQIQANRAPDSTLGPDTVSQAKASTETALAKTATNSSSASVSTPAVTIPPQIAATTSASAQAGGKKPATVKVILAGGKKSTKVILSPTKIKKLPGAAASEKAKTRKVAKKIRVSLHGLNKRVTRANHIRKEATKQPIADVKKTLVSAKLIKPDSKAPEDILRKMYADYMMLKNRAL